MSGPFGAARIAPLAGAALPWGQADSKPRWGRMQVRCSPSCLFLAAASLVTTATAADYFPLDEGLLRTYTLATPDSTWSFSTYFAGTALVLGAEAQVLHFAGGADDGLQQYWSESPEQDTFLNGWYRADCDCGLQYQPPILWIDAPLALGKAWDVTTEAVGWGPVVLHFRVSATGPVTVPAGTFECYSIEWYADEPPPMKVAGIGCLGNRKQCILAANVEAQHFADGTGLVRNDYGAAVASLTRLEPLAVQTATWTHIRELYR